MLRASVSYWLANSFGLNLVAWGICAGGVANAGAMAWGNGAGSFACFGLVLKEATKIPPMPGKTAGAIFFNTGARFFLICFFSLLAKLIIAKFIIVTPGINYCAEYSN